MPGVKDELELSGGKGTVSLLPKVNDAKPGVAWSHLRPHVLEYHILKPVFLCLKFFGGSPIALGVHLKACGIRALPIF